MNIFLVDNNTVDLEHFKKLVSDHTDCQLIYCSSKKVALEIVKHYSPDIFVMNYEAPHDEDIEVLIQLKKYNKDIYTLLFVCSEDYDKLDKAFAAGADDYIARPLEDLELINRLKKAALYKARDCDISYESRPLPSTPKTYKDSQKEIAKPKPEKPNLDSQPFGKLFSFGSHAKELIAEEPLKEEYPTLTRHEPYEPEEDHAKAEQESFKIERGPDTEKYSALKVRYSTPKLETNTDKEEYSVRQDRYSFSKDEMPVKINNDRVEIEKDPRLEVLGSQRLKESFAALKEVLEIKEEISPPMEKMEKGFLTIEENPVDKREKTATENKEVRAETSELFREDTNSWKVVDGYRDESQLVGRSKKNKTRSKRSSKSKGTLAKVFKVLGNLTFIGMLLIMATLAFFLVQSSLAGSVPSVAGYQMYVVLSGSMNPAFDTGSLVFVRSTEPESIEAGDIITYKGASASGPLTTHRVVEVNREGSELNYTTRGDANNVNDPNPVPASNLVGRVEGSFPYLGYMMGFAQTKEGLIVLVFIPGLLVIGFELRNLFKYIGEMDKEKKGIKTEDQAA